MNLAIVEDNAEYSQLVSSKLQVAYKEISIDIYNEGDSFLLCNNHYDVVLLDIELPSIDGIEISKRIRNEDTIIIFLTSISERVFEAFGQNVLGYLLKTEGIDKNIEKLQKLLNSVQIDVVIGIRTPSGDLNIKEKNIVKVVRERRKLFIYTATEKIQLYDTTLDRLYRAGVLFIYPNQSSLINVDHIVSFDNNEVFLHNDHKEFISRNYLSLFKKEYLKRKLR